MAKGKNLFKEKSKLFYLWKVKVVDSSNSVKLVFRSVKVFFKKKTNKKPFGVNALLKVIKCVIYCHYITIPLRPPNFDKLLDISPPFLPIHAHLHTYLSEVESLRTSLTLRTHFEVLGFGLKAQALGLGRETFKSSKMSCPGLEDSTSIFWLFKKDNNGTKDNNCYNCKRNYILFTKCPWSGDSEGTFRSLSQAATCPPVYHTWRRLHAVRL